MFSRVRPRLAVYSPHRPHHGCRFRPDRLNQENLRGPLGSGRRSHDHRSGRTDSREAPLIGEKLLRNTTLGVIHELAKVLRVTASDLLKKGAL